MAQEVLAGALGGKMDAGTASALAGALGQMDAGTAKAALTSVVQSGGSKLNALIGIGLIVYLTVVALQSLLFSFQYAIYSFLAVGVLVVGELPFLAQCGPLAKAASYLTPIIKAYAYGLTALGGVACFVYISWNPLLLAGHAGIGYLAFRCWQTATGETPSAGYEQVGQDTV